MSLSVRLLKWCFLVLLILLVLLAAVLSWVLASESGLQAGVAVSRNFIPEGVDFESVEGRLIGPLKLNGLSVETEAATLNLQALRLDWQPSYLVDGLVKLDSLQVGGVRIQLHETAPSTSSEPTALPERLALPVGLQLDSVLVEDVVVRSGETETVVDRLFAQAQWIDTALTLTEFSVSAPLADLELKGDVETAGDYPLNLSLATTLKKELGLPAAGKVLLAASGSVSDLDLSGRAEVAGETVPELTATYTAKLKTRTTDLSDYAVTANLTVVGQDIDPARYVEQLPGSVALEVTVDVAQRRGGDPTIEVSRLSANGQLADADLAVTGSGSWLGDGGVVKDLRGRWGSYELTANGALGAESDLAWALSLPDLTRAGALLGEDWKGAVKARGKVLGTLEQPQVLVTATAETLAVLGAEVETAKLDADMSLAGDLQFDLLVTNLLVAEEAVDELTLTLNGTQKDHQLTLMLDSPRGEVVLEASGALQDTNDWSFSLSDLKLVHPDLTTTRPDHRWQLAAPAKGKVAADAFSLSPLCLTHVLPDDGGGLCVDAQFVSEKLTAHLELERLGLANLNGLLPADTRVAGVLSGSANWKGNIAETQAAFTLADVGLSVRKDDSWLDVAQFAPGALSVEPDDGAGNGSGKRALQVAIDLPLRVDNAKGVFTKLQVGLTAPSVAQAAQLSGDLAGTVRAELPDLSWLAAFAEQVNRLSGSLSSNVTVAGTLSAPILEGITQLELPEIELADLDLVLSDTSITLEGEPDGLRLTGASHSGEGAIALNSDVSWVDEIEIKGTLTGDKFLVSDSSDARVSISPNLQASFSQQTLKLRGDVLVPLAEITLDKVPDGAVTVSRDQRFPDEEQASAPLATDVRIRLVLGDQISFEGLGLSASFGGALAIRDRTNQTTTATGEIDIIEGTYKAYGQNLTIKQGKLVFAGGRIDEPGLNVRAVRQATPEIEVGVHVQGSLLQPKLDVFSSPSLPQSDQLSYLVLGRPLSASSASENSILQQAAMALGVEGGQLLTERIGKSLGVDTLGIESAPGTSNAQAALVVGKYLSPKLYVSYGYGLFEPISTLRLEYQLAKLWRVVTQSTNEATGGDFLWVYER